MDWGGNLTPGLNGVRLLVLTLLGWGYNIASGERAQWERLSLDVADVLEILAQQAGEFVEVERGQPIGRER